MLTRIRYNFYLSDARAVRPYIKLALLVRMFELAVNQTIIVNCIIFFKCFQYTFFNKINEELI